MALSQIIGITNIVAYGVIPLGLWWIIIHYRPLRLKMAGLFVHMIFVCVRTAMRAAVPESVFWDWNDLHTATAALGAVCLVAGIIAEERRRGRAQ
jgi:hypothetical protein